MFPSTYLASLGPQSGEPQRLPALEEEEVKEEVTADLLDRAAVPSSTTREVRSERSLTDCNVTWWLFRLRWLVSGRH